MSKRLSLSVQLLRPPRTEVYAKGCEMGGDATVGAGERDRLDEWRSHAGGDVN
jgi:hypothetical protein